ncbi:hypothetical protein ACH5RR_000740 [Cinchona calisaya]|uniref:Uncharacterized protein n=1 Tax=Cinchona calisaya TaxID=153742 RepID=A0ABD3B1J1_9GENT
MTSRRNYSSFHRFIKFASLSGNARRMYSSQTYKGNGNGPFASFWEWFRDHRRSVEKSVVFVIIFGSLEMVPCSDRIHLVLSSEHLSNLFPGYTRGRISGNTREKYSLQQARKVFEWRGY